MIQINPSRPIGPLKKKKKKKKCNWNLYRALIKLTIYLPACEPSEDSDQLSLLTSQKLSLFALKASSEETVWLMQIGLRLHLLRMTQILFLSSGITINENMNRVYCVVIDALNFCVLEHNLLHFLNWYIHFISMIHFHAILHLNVYMLHSRWSVYDQVNNFDWLIYCFSILYWKQNTCICGFRVEQSLAAFICERWS